MDVLRLKSLDDVNNKLVEIGLTIDYKIPKITKNQNILWGETIMPNVKKKLIEE